MGKVITLLVLLALAGCSQSGGTFCDLAEPIRLSPDTVRAMTDTEVDAALTHNRLGAQLCGWRP